MTNEERVEQIRALLGAVVAQSVGQLLEPFRVRQMSDELTTFERNHMERYIAKMDLEQGTFREFLRLLEGHYRPYNTPYTLLCDLSDWEGEEPALFVVVPATAHQLLGAIDVNVYRNHDDESLERVGCRVWVDNERNVMIGSAVRFRAKIDVFCSVGDTPELQHRQPVYTVNGMAPDDAGNVEL
jgi:hypothetical protein